jgi:hypothetical protein
MSEHEPTVTDYLSDILTAIEALGTDLARIANAVEKSRE